MRKVSLFFTNALRQQPGEEGGTQQTLLKEATNQQNAICQVFCFFGFFFCALGRSVTDNATYRPSLLLIYDLGSKHFSPLGFGDTLFQGWPVSSALPLGVASLGWLPARCFSGIDALPRLQVLLLDCLHWAHNQQPTTFPILWLKNLWLRGIKRLA